MKIVLIGAPLSGKGSQAELICNHLNIPHISTGDLFRDIMSSNSPLRDEVDKYLSKAVLVPDDLTLKILQERMAQPDTVNGYLLDGFPRTLIQAQKFELIDSIDIAIYLEVDENELIKRISSRMICPNCKKVFTIKGHHNLICNDCGHNLIKRKDDNEETIRQRIAEFNALTLSVVDFYDKQKKLITIDGNRDIQTIFKQIIEIIAEKL